MNENNVALRAERLSLLIGTMMGQISELLNYMQRDPKMKLYYESLFDIQKMASLQIHELYYKNKEIN